MTPMAEIGKSAGRSNRVVDLTSSSPPQHHATLSQQTWRCCSPRVDCCRAKLDGVQDGLFSRTKVDGCNRQIMRPQIQLGDFVGDYGAYQIFLTSTLFIRYVLLGLMANSGPLLTPDVTFYCKLPMEEIEAIMPNITSMNKTEQEAEIKEEFKNICQLDLHLYQQAYLNSSKPNNQRNKNRLNITKTRYRECNDFDYEVTNDQGRTMTSEFDLVCEQDWLRSLFQSIISAAIVVAHVFWGTFSDKYGRFKAQKLCICISLLSGSLSVLPADFWTFVLLRALCSFGDLGLVVSLTTTLVELVGTQYRGFSVALVNFGFALGVTILPYIVAYFENFRRVILFTVGCHLLTMPMILLSDESVRWLITNRRFEAAKKELRRINQWNRNVKVCLKTNGSRELVADKRGFDSLFDELIYQSDRCNLYDPLNMDLQATREEEASRENSDPMRAGATRPTLESNPPKTTISSQIDIPAMELETIQDRHESLMKQRVHQQAGCNCTIVASQLSFVGRVGNLFKDKQLMTAVFTIVWTTFNSELQYTSYIIINLEVGEDLYLNYILGGCMEALAAIAASLLLSYATRRHSLITFWLLISGSCFGLAVAHIDSTWAVWLLALAKFSQSCLSSIACVAAYESFPTFLRQSGSGLVSTIGMLGSVFAPLILAEFDDHAGMDRVLMTFSLSSLTAAGLIHFFLKETKDCELT